MENQHLLLPINRYEVFYEKGSGRPYSTFDTLVLEAIDNGASSLNALMEIFQVSHGRLLLEVLVTLARAGWIAIDAQHGGFSITASGRKAIELGSIPTFSVIEKTFDLILMDSFSGSLIPQSEVQFTTSDRLREEKIWDKAVRLPTLVSDDRIDQGQVKSLLRVRNGEWIRWVNTPRLIARGSQWLRLTYNPDSGRIFFLPERWRELLPPLLEAYLKPSKGIDASTRVYGQPVSPTSVSTPILRDDVIVTQRQHSEALSACLNEAKEFVCITSAFIDSALVDGPLGELIVTAIRRGVSVALLWGYGATEEDRYFQKTIERLNALRERAGKGAGIGRLSFNKTPTESHAKLIISDSQGAWSAWVGSCNWLSSPLGDGDDVCSNVSVRLRNSLLIANLCQSVSSFWLADPARLLTSVPERLRSIMVRLSESAADRVTAVAPMDNQELTAEIDLLRDSEHEVCMRRLLTRDPGSITLTSHRLGPIAMTRLESLRYSRNESVEEIVRPIKNGITVCYDLSSLSNEEMTHVQSFVSERGGRIHRLRGMHCKLIVTGSSVVISSYNFLSADPFGKSNNAREIGITIRGGWVPKYLSELVDSRIHKQDLSPQSIDNVN